PAGRDGPRPCRRLRGGHRRHTTLPVDGRRGRSDGIGGQVRRLHRSRGLARSRLHVRRLAGRRGRPHWRSGGRRGPRRGGRRLPGPERRCPGRGRHDRAGRGHGRRQGHVRARQVAAEAGDDRGDRAEGPLARREGGAQSGLCRRDRSPLRGRDAERGRGSTLRPDRDRCCTPPHGGQCQRREDRPRRAGRL
ncbi:uncharacterized protein METZ01_LOCUS325902, partial [marine metagenome]